MKITLKNLKAIRISIIIVSILIVVICALLPCLVLRCNENAFPFSIGLISFSVLVNSIIMTGLDYKEKLLHMEAFAEKFATGEFTTWGPDRPGKICDPYDGYY